MRVAAAVIGSLLVFSAVVSGSIYPWSAAVFVLVVLAVSCLVAWETGPDGIARLWPALACLALVYVSGIWSVNLSGTLDQAFRLTGYVLFAYVASASVSDDGRRSALLKAVFWSAAAVSVYGIYQYIFGFAHTEEYLKGAEAVYSLDTDRLARADAVIGYGRVFSTMLSPNVLACYLAMVIPTGLSLTGAADSRWRKFSYAAGLAAMLAAAALTRSVGGSAAIVAGVFTYSVTAYTAGGRKLPSGLLAMGGALATSAALMAVLRLGRSGPLGLGWSVEQRLKYWAGAFDAWKASPLTGFGAGSFGVEYMLYMPEGAGETRYAHNLFLQTLAEMGPLGVFAALSVFAYFFFRCARKLQAPGWGTHAPAVMAGGAAFLVHNLVDYTWYVPETAIVFWFLFGLAASGEGTKAVRPSGNALKAAAVALFLIFGIYEVRSYIAGQRLSGALAVLAENGITGPEQARTRPAPEEALELVEGAASSKPYDDSLHAMLAGLYEGRAATDGLKAVERAEKEYLRAIELNPDYPFHYRDLGVLYMRMGDKARARAEFKKAVGRYPSSKPLKKYLDMAEK